MSCYNASTRHARQVGRQGHIFRRLPAKEGRQFYRVAFADYVAHRCVSPPAPSSPAAPVAPLVASPSAAPAVAAAGLPGVRLVNAATASSVISQSLPCLVAGSLPEAATWRTRRTVTLRRAAVSAVVNPLPLTPQPVRGVVQRLVCIVAAMPYRIVRQPDNVPET